jgi:hypothetical protein
VVLQLPRLSRVTSVGLAGLLLVQLATWQATRAQSCNVRLSLDNPEDGAQVVPEQTVSGWAVDLGATTGTGIDSVVVSLDGPLDSPDYHLVGVATYGAPREDIAQNLGDERYTPSGFVLSWDSSTAPPGPHTLWVQAHGNCGWQNASRAIVVSGPVAAAAPGSTAPQAPQAPIGVGPAAGAGAPPASTAAVVTPMPVGGAAAAATPGQPVAGAAAAPGAPLVATPGVFTPLPTTTALKPPQNLRILAGTTTGVTLAWDPPAGDSPVGYLIHQANIGPSGQPTQPLTVARLPANTTSVTLSGLQDPTRYTYYFTVSSIGANGLASPFLNTDLSTTPPGTRVALPPAPAGGGPLAASTNPLAPGVTGAGTSLTPGVAGAAAPAGGAALAPGAGTPAIPGASAAPGGGVLPSGVGTPSVAGAASVAGTPSVAGAAAAARTPGVPAPAGAGAGGAPAPAGAAPVGGAPAVAGAAASGAAGAGAAPVGGAPAVAGAAAVGGTPAVAGAAPVGGTAAAASGAAGSGAALAPASGSAAVTPTSGPFVASATAASNTAASITWPQQADAAAYNVYGASVMALNSPPPTQPPGPGFNPLLGGPPGPGQNPSAARAPTSNSPLANAAPGTWVPLANNTQTTSTTVQGLTPGGAYAFVVRAVNAAGQESSQSAPGQVSLPLTLAAAPAGIGTGAAAGPLNSGAAAGGAGGFTLTATSGATGGATLTWSPVSGAISYSLLVSRQGAQFQPDPQRVAMDGTATTIDGIPPNAPFTFQVVARDASGAELARSNPAPLGAPGAQGGPAVPGGAAGQFGVPPQGGAAQPGGVQPGGVQPGGAPGPTGAGSFPIAPGAAAGSAPAPQTSTLASGPSTVLQVNSNPSDPGTANLQWTQIRGATSYSVWLTPPTGASQVIVPSTSNLAAYIPNLPSGQYTVQVKARDANGNEISVSSPIPITVLGR